LRKARASSAWDTANYLHVWGFHEAKLDSKAVELRVRYVERTVIETKELVGGEALNAQST
jgi:hypothetical protein